MDNRDRNLDDELDVDLGNPLGIAREPVPHDEKIHASDDDESVRRRRERAGIGPDLEERYTGLENIQSEGGATGIDMGSGGQGTNVSDRGTGTK